MEEVFDQYDLELIRQEVWDLLEVAVHSYRAPFHAAVVATLNEGVPDLRTVILRKADRESRILSFHTDIRSPKVTQLTTDPQVSWLFYDPVRRIQLRCYAKATLHSNDEVADLAWERSRLSSRLCYTTSSPSGSFLSEPELIDFNRKDVSEEESSKARSHFGVVSSIVYRIDWLYLHHRGHRRAIFDYHQMDLQWVQV